MDDGRIVALYLSRDEEAISASALAYGPRLKAVGRNLLRDESTVEECENDTYLHAWNAIPPHEPRGYLFAFLARIMRHLVLDVCRKRRREPPLTELTQEMEQCIPAPSDLPCRVDEILLGEILTGFLQALPETQRDVFLRRYWYFDPVADIARRFHFSESKVKSMLFRTRNLLRDHLMKEGYDL